MCCPPTEQLMDFSLWAIMDFSLWTIMDFSLWAIKNLSVWAIMDLFVGAIIDFSLWAIMDLSVWAIMNRAAVNTHGYRRAFISLDSVPKSGIAVSTKVHMASLCLVFWEIPNDSRATIKSCIPTSQVSGFWLLHTLQNTWYYLTSLL